MATVGGLSSGASNSVSMYGASIKGYGGLASGLDTDSLIEGMTTGTRTKIQEALKKKQNYQWEMDAYRSVSDPLIAFSSKYLNVTSSSSPYRSSFFDKSMVTAHGLNSKNLSVSGASALIDKMSVLGIKQLAKDSSLVTKNNDSIKALNTGGVNFGADIDVSKLEGGDLKLTYGNYTYNVHLSSGDELFGAGAPGTNMTDYSTLENAKNSINAILRNTKVAGEGETGYLIDKVQMFVNGDQLVVKKMGTAETSPEDLFLSGGTSSVLKLMGFMNEDGQIKNSGYIPQGDGLVGDKHLTDSDIATKHKFSEYMGDKTITFNYNGNSKRIKLPSKEFIQSEWLESSPGVPATKKEGMDKMAAYLNNELGKAFGTGKISVSAVDGSGGGDPTFSFTTPDPSSILRIASADDGIMGKKGLFGIGYATTNRLNMEDPLTKSGLAGFASGGLPVEKDADGNIVPGGRVFGDYELVEEEDADGNKTGRAKRVYAKTDYNDEEGNLYININGTEIKGLKVDSSLSQIMKAINDSDAGVRMNYNETADRISMAATNHGEAGKIDISAVGGEKLTDPADPNSPKILDPNQNNFLKLLIGDNTKYDFIQGQDAIMTVKYEGNVETDIKRDTNSFKLEGSTFTLTNTFGFKEGLVDTSGNSAGPFFDSNGKPIREQVKAGAGGTTTIPPLYNADGTLFPPPSGMSEGDVLYNFHTPVADTEPVTFTSAVDTEKVVKVISSMIEDYNKMADQINKLVSTKPDRGYGPLTDDEKATLNQDQITKLEDKAKEGILFNDPLLRSLSDKMRSVFSGVADVGTLKEMGLTLSNSWKDNGKISFDEEKFKNALLENSEKVKTIFTEPSAFDANGVMTKAGGISVRLKSIADDYAAVNTFRKGSLIAKAGSTASPTSLLDNAIKKSMDSIDKDVERLKDKLQIEIDRYTKQFSSLEQLISQMNSQSSWFSQAMG